MTLDLDGLTKFVMFDYRTGNLFGVTIPTEDADALITQARRGHDGGDPTVLITSVATREPVLVSITPELADRIAKAAFAAKPHPSL